MWHKTARGRPKLSRKWLKVLRRKDEILAAIADRTNIEKPIAVASDSSSESSSSSSSENSESEDEDSGQESLTAKKRRRKSDYESSRNRKDIYRIVSIQMILLILQFYLCIILIFKS